MYFTISIPTAADRKMEQVFQTPKRKQAVSGAVSYAALMNCPAYVTRHAPGRSTTTCHFPDGTFVKM